MTISQPHPPLPILMNTSLILSLEYHTIGTLHSQKWRGEGPQGGLES